ncbi:MAG: flagellar basal body-associated FliL family protein [Bdellovibrionaceae bacterium]|nr:flagellar basal body-associated FliL family protein [Pseudobdellovibrionaceae bacterium]MDW8190846.1 flagellar basal body-associated FliL family protein [Pseudobdellovibrionaceae bacterium]
MATENATTAENKNDSGKKDKLNWLVLGLVVLNTIAVAMIAFMVAKNREQESKSSDNIDAVVRGELQTQKEEAAQKQKNERVFYQLKDFVVNLSGSRGRRIIKASIELELPNQNSKNEVESLEAQIRDQIILILSSKNYEEIASKEGKEALRNEIKLALNPSLSDGNKILNIYFTEFIYN